MESASGREHTCLKNSSSRRRAQPLEQVEEMLMRAFLSFYDKLCIDKLTDAPVWFYYNQVSQQVGHAGLHNGLPLLNSRLYAQTLM